MRQIDQLLESMSKFGAQAALLTSGERVQLAFPTGNRYAAQSTPHSGLVAMVEEILPSGTALNPSGTTKFLYDSAGVPVLVSVETGIKGWRVSVKPQKARPSPSGTAGAAPEPPAATEPAAAPEP
ncbi:MAG TPA: hypothetical protein VFZ57_00710, partial [Thermoanaerobaculia bacterium]|nr:hypothetical protein [Thermoanaerobaculia bacterium]